jgi:hypothetical protein
VERVPYQAKVIEYEEYEYEEEVPVSRLEYKEVLVKVPVERKVVEYIAVETRTSYEPVLAETRNEKVPVRRTVTKASYRPVTRII